MTSSTLEDGKLLFRSVGRPIGRLCFYGGEVMTVKDKKTCFVEKIGGTTFIVNALSAEGAKQTQEELVKALIAKEAMSLSADSAA